MLRLGVVSHFEHITESDMLTKIHEPDRFERLRGRCMVFRWISLTAPRLRLPRCAAPAAEEATKNSRPGVEARVGILAGTFCNLARLHGRADCSKWPAQRRDKFTQRRDKFTEFGNKFRRRTLAKVQVHFSQQCLVKCYTEFVAETTREARLKASLGRGLCF